MMTGLTGEVSVEEQESVTWKVVEAVAEEKGVSPLDLEPLNNIVNPDALDKLFRPVSGTDRSLGQVSFRYSGYEISVFPDGDVEVSSLEI